MKLNKKDIAYIIGKTKSLVKEGKEEEAIRILNGEDESVDTFAILTSENPHAQQLSDEENSVKRAELENALSRMGYRWFPMTGKYDNEENSYMIFNISEEETFELGKQFGQKGVIFSEKEDNGGSKRMVYKYYEEDDNGNYQMISKKDSYLNMDGFDNNYSQISKDFKFQIPF